MKKLAGKAGTILFWLTLPMLAVYLRLGGTRNYIVVIFKGEVLLLQGLLTRKEYSLPGGGAGRRESSESAAVRELKEETGIVVKAANLKKVGYYEHNKYGIKYNANIYATELRSKPELKLPKKEIWNAQWVKLNKTHKLYLSSATAYALECYQSAKEKRLV